MMLAFTVFWAYISFSQYFLIYSANIPEETFWYNIREKNYSGELNSWWWVSMGLIFGHFLTPFLAYCGTRRRWLYGELSALLHGFLLFTYLICTGTLFLVKLMELIHMQQAILCVSFRFQFMISRRWLGLVESAFLRCVAA